MVRDSEAVGYRWVGLAVLAVSCGLLASPGAPQQSPPSIAANEAAAISTLREIAAAEARVRADGTIDTNCDGVGEYAYLAELAGTKPKRVCAGGMPEEGNWPADAIHPPLIRPALGTMTFNAPLVEGYRFGMWLPSVTYPLPYGSDVFGFAEDWNGGKESAPYPGSRNGAGLWCCYAWPERAGVTGNRAFFINQRGELLQCANDGPNPFSGPTYHHRPLYGEAFTNRRDMSSALRLGIPGGFNNSIWTRVW